MPVHNRPSWNTDEDTRTSRTIELPIRFVPRNRLLELVEGTGPPALTLISAPAGHGKSVLAAHWARTTGIPVCWLQMSASDNQLSILLYRIYHGVISAARNRMEPGFEPATDVSLEALIYLLRHLGSRGQPVGIVLDDFHLITNRDVHEMLLFLVENVPQGHRLVIVSRTPPPWPLARLRAQGRLREVTAADLAFDEPETQRFLSAGPEALIADTAARAIREHTEGWIAGIQLALLGGWEAADERALPEASGATTYLDEYIDDEVLFTLDPPLRTFVLKASFLPSLDPELCRNVIGAEETRAFLAQLVRLQVFIVPVREEPVARFHHLFAESVQRIAASELPSDDLRELHGRLASWFRKQGNRELAVEHLIAAEQWDDVTPLLVEVCAPLADADLFPSLAHWLNQVPDHIRTGHPDLVFWLTYANFALSNFRDAQALYALFIAPWHHSPDPLLRGRANTVLGMMRSLQNDVEATVELSRAGLDTLPESARVERLHCYHGLLEGEFALGNDEAAREAYIAASEIRRLLPADQRWWRLHTRVEPANQRALRGELVAARDLYNQVRKEYGDRLPHQLRKFRYRLAEIAIARGEIEEAGAELAAMVRETDGERPYWYIEAMLTEARLARLLREDDRAETLLLDAIVHAEEDGSPIVELHARASLASLWVETGRLSLARQWMEDTRADVFPWARVFGASSYRLVRCEVLLANGQTDAALEEIDCLIDEGTRLKRWAELVNLQTYKAAGHQALRQTARSREAMRDAVRLGSQGGFVFPFLSRAWDLSPIFQGLQVDPGIREYVAMLERATASYREDDSPQLLSPRELEILKLVALGYSNREIANRLYISEPTVKRHLANLNVKLDTSNRSGAVARASDLGLFS